MSTHPTQYPTAAWQPVEPDGRVRLLPAACIALRFDTASCASCRSACPVDCIQIDASKFRVSEHCIGCGHCAAACPTGAMAVKGFAEIFALPSARRVLRVECLKVDRRIAGEAARVPCLGGLSAADWLGLFHHAQGSVVQAIDRSWCGQCEVAKQITGKHPASTALEQVRHWLEEMGVPDERLPTLVAEPLPVSLMPRQIPGDAPTAPARRGFFLRLGNEARRAVGGETGPAIPTPRGLRSAGPMPLPARERLMVTLQQLARELDQPLPAAHFHTLQVGSSCTHHTVCVGICPTQALTRYTDTAHAGIEFIWWRCIGCGKCTASCPERALTLHQASSLLAIGASLRLTAHPLRVCAECLQPFPDTSSSALCSSCRRQHTMAADLFKRL